jgi:hypothetical protein
MKKRLLASLGIAGALSVGVVATLNNDVEADVIPATATTLGPVDVVQSATLSTPLAAAVARVLPATYPVKNVQAVAINKSDYVDIDAHGVDGTGYGITAYHYFDISEIAASLGNGSESNGGRYWVGADDPGFVSVYYTHKQISDTTLQDTTRGQLEGIWVSLTGDSSHAPTTPEALAETAAKLYDAIAAVTA